MPQITNLVEDASSFIASAKRALQHLAEVLNEFYGITISNARFDKGREQLEALTPRPAEQMEILEAFRSVIERILHLRNHLDHTPKKTLFENFHLSANALHSPTWRVTPDPAAPIIPEMCDFLRALIGVSENSFFTALLDNLDCPPGPFGYVVEEIPEAEWDKDCPIRFRCELQLVSQS